MKPSSRSSSGMNFPGEPTSSSAKFEGRNLQLVSSNSERHPLNGPALKIIWKGCFKRFLAHASTKISRKAYEFARQIAGVLQFRIHPRRAFWPDIFKSDCPDANDIALYFYPERIERPKQQYAFLLKLIERQDLMLRSHMGDVELLVFPSKLLHADSQKLDGNYFMWGVFRCLKDEKVANKAEARPTTL